jgi:hypothetical protein
VLRAAALAASVVAAAAPATETLSRRVAAVGPRPAASRGEHRAQALVAGIFRRAGLRVSVQRFHVPRHGNSSNVIGALDTPHRCLTIVIAHIDTGTAGPGANDNASGVGVMAALAPRLRRVRPSCDVWLASTGAEERGYTHARDHLGALALAKRVRGHALAPHLRWALSLDEVGRGSSFLMRSPVSRPRRGVERRFMGPRVGWMRDHSTGNSDHREFQLLGMPAAKLGGRDEPCRELACDRPGRLQRSALELARRVVERALSP